MTEQQKLGDLLKAKLATQQQEVYPAVTFSDADKEEFCPIATVDGHTVSVEWHDGEGYMPYFVDTVHLSLQSATKKLRRELYLLSICQGVTWTQSGPHYFEGTDGHARYYAAITPTPLLA